MALLDCPPQNPWQRPPHLASNIPCALWIRFGAEEVATSSASTGGNIQHRLVDVAASPGLENQSAQEKSIQWALGRNKRMIRHDFVQTSELATANGVTKLSPDEPAIDRLPFLPMGMLSFLLLRASHRLKAMIREVAAPQRHPTNRRS